jgi:hypothetical protein
MSFGRIQRILAVLCAALILCLSVTASQASDVFHNPAEDSTSHPVVDLLILRPLGAVSALVSTLVFVFPVTPIVLITRPMDIDKPFVHLVVEPTRYVVVDRIGEH